MTNKYDKIADLYREKDDSDIILSISDNFETVSKNIKSYPYTLNYTGTQLTSIVYDIGVGTITKTFNYVGSQIVSIVLSGDTPNGIELNKVFTYTGPTLSSITYL